MIRGIYTGIAYVDIVLDFSGLAGPTLGTTCHGLVQIGKYLTDLNFLVNFSLFVNMMRYRF
jgi:hypothetical protein